MTTTDSCPLCQDSSTEPCRYCASMTPEERDEEKKAADRLWRLMEREKAEKAAQA